MKHQFLLIITAIVVLTVLTGCSQHAAKAKVVKPVKVKAVELQSSAQHVRYSASIRPSSQVDVAFKVSGYIDSIAGQKDAAGQWRHIQAGDTVRKGTVLARVRQSDYVARVNEVKSQSGEARLALEMNHAQLKEARAAIETSRAQVLDAQATFDRAKLDFDRSNILFSTQSITKPEFDASKAQYEIAKAKLDAAQSQLRVAEARVNTAQAQIGAAESRVRTTEASTFSATIPLGDTQLTAPLNAIVIERKVEVGSLVSQGGLAFVLADLSSVKAAFGVPDLTLQNLQVGDVLNVTTDVVPGTEFQGHISRISPAADQNSRVFDVEVTIPNPQGLLKPGMIASLAVTEGDGLRVEVPVVPLTSIIRSKADARAFAVMVIEQKDGKQFARFRTVTLGESFGNAVAIVSGLQPGELVITTGATQVADGEEVSVMP
jgi:RND family efflux transporter MFP subunit